MREKFPEIIERYRQGHPVIPGMESRRGDKNGFFVIPKNGNRFRIILSDEGGWDHISVSLNRRRCPFWDEMCWVKNLFFDPQEAVVQFHPAKDHYVNNHEFCLHIWRFQKGFPVPHPIMVGLKL